MTPSAEPDPLEGVVALVARPDALELRDEQGATLASLAYDSSTTDALATLTALFDAPPSSESFDGNSHYPPSTAHRWEGFELWEQRHVDRWAEVEHSPIRPEFLIRFTGPEARGFELASTDGRHVGDDWSVLMADPAVRTVPSGCSGPYLDFVELDAVHSGVEEKLKISVEFRPTDDQSAIASIAAPVPVYDDGCA
ncbi:hypothetical protein ACFPER_12715 [Agromyces aurantiacus]|uniref:Uncharacterized protein n=1 Tax=Agromyces aurantiacus TaxID=165814 RepID=A0ABV9R6A4_9MICO|nr:hypothetical protein [Agromyces aurantiacus]MBM7504345.1 hypothetical protein [Agromyces aurantiacus]